MNRKLLFSLGLLVPFVFVFRAFFMPGSLVFGDAPYFYPDGLREWAKEPYSWISFGNNFGGVNVFLWIYPLMFIYGILNLTLGFNNDIVIRILFYFPATILAILGPIFFARFLGFGKKVQFFASLIYVFNTYFLLLLDGGQVGVALAYGIFPFTLLYLRRFMDFKNLNNFLVASLISFILIIADPRIALICYATIFIWIFVEMVICRKIVVLKNIQVVILLLLFLVVLSAYWVIPTVLFNKDLNLEASSFNAFSFLNPLFLFQPHWPFNEFGKISIPPFYFLAVPILIFGGLIFRRDKKILTFVLIFITLAFFVKGDTPPLGQLYSFLVTNIPLGVAFRDSSKFFTPLLLFAGLLIGLLAERVKVVFSIFVYIYVLLLIYPAIIGQLNGVLKIREVPKDFNIIAHQLSNESEPFRSIWFPQRPPFAFHTEQKQALDAKNLIWERPFASLNVGTFDHFNFLHNRNSIELFKLLGIKYLFFPGDFRKDQLSEGETNDWSNLLSLVNNTTGISEEKLGVDFPIFSIPDIKPRVFGVNKLLAVIGSDDIYNKLSPNNYAFIFLEDGKMDPKRLSKTASSSVVLVFNGKEKIDLTMSFLQRYFLNINENKFSQWAVRQPEQYLQWKYELLNRGIETHEFDYGQGIAFSDQKEEVLSFELEAPKDGEYVLAVRAISFPSDTFQVNFKGEEFKLESSKKNVFEWFTKQVAMPKGKYKIMFKNLNGISVLNTAALVPKEDFLESESLASEFLFKFNEKSESIWRPLDYKYVSPVYIKVNSIPSDINWIVFSDNYNNKWNSYPFYSMINGFYIEPGLKEVEIKFNGQEYVKIGWTITITSLIILAGLFLYSLKKKD